MTNKEYKALREQAEQAPEIYTFESYVNNGWYGFYNRYMKPDDLKEMRQEYREMKHNNRDIITLEDFGGRALIIPTETGAILQSYYTKVAEIRDGKFIKLWDGYSKTTHKHIDAFRRYYGLSYVTKRELIEMTTEV